MTNLACRAAWVLHKTSRLPVCRIIAGRRFPQATRAFRSPSHLRSADDDAAKPSWNHVKGPLDTPPTNEFPKPKPDAVIDSTDAAADPPRQAEEEAIPAGVEGSQQKTAKLSNRGTYGSALRRSGRNTRSVKNLPAVTLPAWFLERNVLLYKDEVWPEAHHLTMFDPQKHKTGVDKLPECDAADSKAAKNETAASTESNKSPANPPAPGSSTPSDTSDYYIHKYVMFEIGTTVSAGLRLPAARHADSYAASKPHLLLQCPKDGGIMFLNSVVQFASQVNEADLVSLDAQDIVEVAFEYAGDLPDCSFNSVWSLGYDTHLMMARRDQPSMNEEMLEDRDEEEAEDDVPRRLSGPYPKIKVTAMPTITFVGSEKISELLNSDKMNNLSTFSDRPSPKAKPNASRNSNSDLSNHARVDLLLEAFLDAARAKRRVHRKPSQSPNTKGTNTESSPPPETGSNNQSEGSNAGQENPHNPLIVLIRDFAEMNATATGGPVLDRLFEIVSRKRKEGQRVLVIGTTSSPDLIPSLSQSGFKNLQTEPGQGPYRVIVTPCEPASASAAGGILERCHKGRTHDINVRHLQDMIRRLAPDPQRVSDFVSQSPLRFQLDSTTAFISGLEEEIWSFDRVHRAAMMVLGLLKEEEELTTRYVGAALRMLDSSDNAKFDWLRCQREEEKKLAATDADKPTDAKVRGQKDLEDRIKKLQKSCSSHEKKLLNGVVDAANIRTTFADVQANPETIETLKTLTSLSLLRPEAFTYGVLATDKIPGLLLYGPPGTGKTLLARAVAKESGATVLEVSGSDVYDKYVGESEKNVRAIFSLARKLTPCIVFIDEADAIFATRDSQHKRTSHREIINQFLREWDGMNDASAFIMVATNRPYDLDDAVLRRLPRRLLVDLPKEKDREAILRIHLKNELRDASVSLSDLASQTPFYSGSDLKNLSVAAALICVREENEAAKAHDGPTPYEHAPKRTLTLRHFEKAMDEISASISEDMSSLSAIRKFDEKYGDRKGRRKKSAGYGFGTKTESEKNNSDLVRVRA